MVDPIDKLTKAELAVLKEFVSGIVGPPPLRASYVELQFRKSDPNQGRYFTKPGNGREFGYLTGSISEDQQRVIDIFRDGVVDLSLTRKRLKQELVAARRKSKGKQKVDPDTEDFDLPDGGWSQSINSSREGLLDKVQTGTPNEGDHARYSARNVSRASSVLDLDIFQPSSSQTSASDDLFHVTKSEPPVYSFDNYSSPLISPVNRRMSLPPDYSIQDTLAPAKSISSSLRPESISRNCNVDVFVFYEDNKKAFDFTHVWNGEFPLRLNNSVDVFNLVDVKGNTDIFFHDPDTESWVADKIENFSRDDIRPNEPIVMAKMGVRKFPKLADLVRQVRLARGPSRSANKRRNSATDDDLLFDVKKLPRY